MFTTKVRISQVHPTRIYGMGATTKVLSGWLPLADAQTMMGEWSYHVIETDMLILSDRFGRQVGLGLMGKTADLFA